MERIKNLIDRFWPTGALFIIGFILIIYIAFGFVYLQQGTKQGELNEQIARLEAVTTRPLVSGEELQAEYDKVNSPLGPLAPMTASDAIKRLAKIAEQSGIDVSEASGKFTIVPGSATFSQAKVGGSTYQLISFRGIHVQGDYDNVMAFISDLDSGKTLGTMVLKGVVANKVEVSSTGVEEDTGTKIETTITVDVDIYTNP